MTSTTTPAHRSAAALSPDFSFRDEPPVTGLRSFAPGHVVFLPAPASPAGADRDDDLALDIADAS